MRPGNKDKAKLFGMRVDLKDMEGAASSCMALIGESGGYVVTLNPEMCLKSLEDSSFKDAVDGAAMVVPDGAGAVWALKRLGHDGAQKVPGIELAEELAGRCAASGVQVYLVGAKPGVAERAAANLVLRHKGLKIAGARDGYFTEADESGVIDSCMSSGAGLVMVAMGAGRQEAFMRRASARAKGVLFIGIGGSFDVFSGDVKRAPAIFRQLSLEWLYRGLSDMSRLKRLAKLPTFVAIVAARPRLARNGRPV